jgi:putative Holliday junction resolvase
VGRLIGLDIGDRRIGIAISDPDGRIAVPLRVLERSEADDDVLALVEIAGGESAEGFVAGLPRSLDGTLSAQAERVQSFARKLNEISGLRVDYWDERLTTVQANRIASSGQGGGKRKKRARESRDDLAASIILQAYLDRQRAARA